MGSSLFRSGFQGTANHFSGRFYCPEVLLAAVGAPAVFGVDK